MSLAVERRDVVSEKDHAGLHRRAGRWRRLRNQIAVSGPWWGLRIVVALLYTLMLAPILITFAVSFNEKNQSKFPPQGFSTVWWEEALSAEWLQPLLFSLKLAGLTALLCTLLGVPLAFALVRWKFRGKHALQALTFAPLLLPALVTGMALLQFFHTVGIGHIVGFFGLVIAHVVISLSFTVRTVAISLTTISPNLELAAASLGASPRRTMIRLILPLAKNGVIAGAVFSFIHSFTDINVSLFLARPAQEPITVRIISHLEWGYGPTIAAIGMISLFVPLVLVLVIERVSGLSNFLYGESRNG